MSEISQLTKKFDDFALKFAGVIGGHTASIKDCKKVRDDIVHSLDNGTDGLKVRIKGLETSIKGKQSFLGSTLTILTTIFMGGIFIMWLIRMIGENT